MVSSGIEACPKRPRDRVPGMGRRLSRLPCPPWRLATRLGGVSQAREGTGLVACRMRAKHPPKVWQLAPVAAARLHRAHAAFGPRRATGGAGGGPRARGRGGLVL